MTRNEYVGQAVAFVVIVAAIVGGVALAGSMRTADSAEYGQAAPVQYKPENVLVTVSAEKGTIKVRNDAKKKTVVIDQAHGNSFGRNEIEPLVSALVKNGHTVEFFGSDSSTRVMRGNGLNATLRSADAYVIINPTRQFSESEINGLSAFIDGGGRVLVLGDPAEIQSTGFLGPVVQVSHDPTNFASEFGISVGSGYLYNMRTGNRDNNFINIHVTPTDSKGTLTEGVDRVIMRDAAPLHTARKATVLLRGAKGTHLSSTRKPGNYGVLARNGNLTVVGDTSFLEPSSVYDADNEVLAGNLIEFLVTGETADCLIPKSGGDSRFRRNPRQTSTPSKNTC